MMKLAILDFCDTIVDFQTANAYVNYTLDYFNIHSIYRKISRSGIAKRFFSKHWVLEKRLLLFMLRGLDKEMLDRAAEGYYIDLIKPHFQIPVINKILELRDQGYTLYLVSGGYTIYIQHFAKEFGFEKVISNDFAYKNESFTGRLCDNDCMGEEKVIRINTALKDATIEDSVSISDSRSDLPILKWASRAIVVSKTAHRKWPDEYGFEQMVLSEYINHE